MSDYRRSVAMRDHHRDWWRTIEKLHIHILKEIDEPELTPAVELLHQHREERDAELIDLITCGVHSSTTSDQE